MILSLILNLVAAFFLNTEHLPAATFTDSAIVRLRPDAPVAPWQDGNEKAAVLAANGRFFLFSRRADEPQPIASITKLMTALVFLDNNPGWETVYKIGPEDHIEGGRLNLFLGDRVTIRDLFNTSLVASDNGATVGLVHATGLSEAEFVNRMNQKAEALGLGDTRFADPIGLSRHNVSTAREVAKLAQAALAVPEIRSATARSTYSFTTLEGRAKEIESTDDLLFTSGGIEILGGKTGYTDEAGYCYVGYMRGPDGREVISAVLGSDSRSDRFRASRDLAQWALDYYDWSGLPVRPKNKQQ